jgi:hypothetical protein
VALTVLYGTLGLTDALYMTVTIPATVGYGEVRPLDPSGPGLPLPARAWETRARYPDAQVLAFKRSSDTHIAVPDHDTVLGAGDLILVLGPEQTLKAMTG